MFGNGGCLILGRHYAESSRIFFGLNPGFPKHLSTTQFDVGPCSSEGTNYPFSYPDKDSREPEYFRNCRNFLNAYPGLKAWFDEGVTSTFLCPWRTADVPTLHGLNMGTDGRLFKYSGNLLQHMIKDHEAKIAVIAGACGVSLLKQVLNAPECVEFTCDLVEGYGRRIYQWSRWNMNLNGRKLMVLQIPHFSRANSPDILRPCANWLMRQFGV
jgi:hypothetical protein